MHIWVLVIIIVTYMYMWSWPGIEDLVAVNFYGLWPEASAPGSGHTALGLNAPSSKYKYTNTNREASERTVALDTLPLASMVPPQ